ERPPPPPLRIVLSNTLKVALASKLVASAYEHPVIVYCSESSAAAQRGKVHDLRNRGVRVVPLPDHESHFSLADALSDLHQRRVTHLLVEPGPTLTRYMFARNQADRVWVFRSPNPIEDSDGLAISSAPVLDYPETGEVTLDGDVLAEFLNP